MKRVFSLALVAAALFFPPAALPQSHSGYPARPIRMIAPSSAGGPTDIVARAIAQGLAVALGQQVVIDNRAGAGGSIGAKLVARAAPDGYTVMISHSGPLAIEPLLHSKPAYDPAKDFAPISLVAASPYILLVNPSVPAKSVKELVALAKSRRECSTTPQAVPAPAYTWRGSFSTSSAALRLRTFPIRALVQV